MPSKHGKGWRARWIDEHGKRQSESFKYRRDAEQFERTKKAETEQVHRGLRRAAPVDRTFRELKDYWLANRVPAKRSGEHDASIINAHLKEFDDELLRDIGVATVDRFVVTRAHLDKKTLSNILTLLISMLKLAVELEWLEKAPKIKKPRIRLINSDYRYLRTDAEIRRFLLAAGAEAEMVFVLYAMAVYTGMRAGELAGLHWDDISFEQRLITVHRSYRGPTKAEDVRHVPILDALLPILRRWRLRHPGRLVFTNAAGTMLGRSARVFQEVLRRVLDRGGFPQQSRKGKLRRYIVSHDLRHTFASTWMMKGGDLFRLQKILGHKTVQMTLRYAHLAPAAYAEDWGRFATFSAEDATVTSIAAVATTMQPDDSVQAPEEETGKSTAVVAREIGRDVWLSDEDSSSDAAGKEARHGEAPAHVRPGRGPARPEAPDPLHARVTTFGPARSSLRPHRALRSRRAGSLAQQSSGSRR